MLMARLQWGEPRGPTASRGEGEKWHSGGLGLQQGNVCAGGAGTGRGEPLKGGWW